MTDILGPLSVWSDETGAYNVEEMSKPALIAALRKTHDFFEQRSAEVRRLQGRVRVLEATPLHHVKMRFFDKSGERVGQKVTLYLADDKDWEAGY